MPPIFQKYDPSLERCIRYVKLLLCILGLLGLHSSLKYNRSAIAHYNAVNALQSFSIFRVAQNAIENFYSGVQNEISLVRFIVESETPIDLNHKSLDALLKYGEFISLREGGKTGDEVGPVGMQAFKDATSELITIRNVALNSTLCVKHTNLDHLSGAVRRMVYYLPVRALYHTLKDALTEIEGKLDFSIVDKNYNEIYHPFSHPERGGFKECRSIYSSPDNELYFCQSGSSHISYTEVVTTVLSVLIPLFIVLSLFFFLRKLEIAVKRSIRKPPAPRDTCNPLLMEQTPTNSSNFISCITHELRTPLNVIIAFSEMIKDECLGNITNKKYVCYGKEIHRFGISLLKTVDNIIDITKSNNMLMQPQKKYASINQVLAETLKNCKALALEKEISLCKNIDPDLPKILLDGNHVKKALMNILSNAIKFSQHGSTVSIKAHHNVDDKSIAVTIEDSGTGMTVVDGIPQLENSLTKKTDGLGIGLLLSRNILRLNNASLEIHSQLGKGTSSIITFYREDLSEEV